MNLEYFCQQVIEASRLPFAERHKSLLGLHARIVKEYVTAVKAISPELAAQRAARGYEVRTLGQVVGHMAEWDRYSILAAGEILAGVRRPRMLSTLDGYLEPDGTRHAFNDIEDFNQFQLKRQANWPWEQIRTSAIQSATVLYGLFADPVLMNAQRLEQTEPSYERLPNGTLIPDLAMGWCLWLIVIEHAGVEHAPELRMET